MTPADRATPEPLVVVTDAEFANVDPEREILEGAGLRVDVAQCRTAQDVIDAAHGASALIVQYAPISAEVFAALDDLRIVSRYGVGVDTVDVDAATDHGVWVAHVPDYGTEEVAAHTVGMLLALVRHVPFHDRAVRAGIWDLSVTGVHERLSTMTLGLIGLGRIGRTVAERAGPWFGRVVAYDPFLPDDGWPADVARVELDDLFAASEVVSLHLPLTDETRGLIDQRRLELAPDRGLYLVNTARGGLVDLDALLGGLEAGRVRGAALDVLPEEPPPAGHPILTHDRALVTPHAAWHSRQAAADLRRLTAENIVTWHRTGHPRTPVNQPRPRSV